MEIKHKSHELTQGNWAALQQLYEYLYGDDHENNSGEFWHYTSARGVLGIFGDYVKSAGGAKNNVRHCSMLASNIRFMNDSKEYEEGVECYENLCKVVDSKVKKYLPTKSTNSINDNIYLISFCESGDLLSQWKWYGKNSGISIRFNIENIAYKTYEYENEKGEKEECDLADTHTKPLRVKYTNEDKKSYFNTLLNHNLIAVSKAYELLRLAFVPFCKHEGFAEEKESRLVFYIGDLTLSEAIKGKFNIEYNTFEEGRIKPALKVQMECKDELSETENIISEMIVGPGVNQELVFNLLIHAFDRTNYCYHNDKSEGVFGWNEFMKQDDHKVHYVKCRDDKCREAYKCENGIVIMKSSIPFRG